MGLEMLPDENGHGSDAGHRCQYLADPEGAPSEAVHPETFDEGSAQTVPGSVAQGHLTVILALAAQRCQQYEAN